MITLIPYAGLANRIRCVCSVHRFCKENNIDFKICWTKEKSFNASFQSIFETENLDFIVDDNAILNNILYLSPLGHKYSLASLFAPVFSKKVYTNLLPPELINDSNKLSCSINGIDKDIDNIIISYSILYKSTPVDNIFVPIKAIRDIINSNCEKFTDNVIGLHIRRTDHVISKNATSIDYFEGKVNDLIDEHSDLRIFLCTDDTYVKGRFLKKYGHHIITYDSVLNRTSYEGIRDAVVELWTLAHTNEIYGSFGSSFSKMAARIYNKPYNEIKEK